MTAIEWIDLAQDRLRRELVSSAIPCNIEPLEDAIKFLNEAKALISEHQDRLRVKIEDVLTTRCQVE